MLLARQIRRFETILKWQSLNRLGASSVGKSSFLRNACTACCNKPHPYSSTIPRKLVRTLGTISHIKSGQHRAHLDDKERLLKVYWRGEKENIFPFVWLRDNCQCSKCFHPTTLSRQILMRDLDVNCYPKNIQFNDGEEKLEVVWNDGHVSSFKYDFLKKRSFTPDEQATRMLDYIPGQRVLWGKDNFKDISRHDYNEVMTTDNALCKMLTDIYVYGLTLVCHAPKSKDTLGNLSEKVSYPMETNYGHWFEVKSLANPSNLAYTPNSLGLHIDLPFYAESPGIQLLHCISQDEGVIGGENQFSDAIYVAGCLKETDPETYRLLTTVKVDFYDYGTDHLKDFHLLQRQNIIDTDNEGNIIRINYNNAVRDFYLNIPWQQVQPFYNAQRKFEDILMSERVDYKLKEGEIVIFDNQRVLHGRSAYTMSAKSERYLRGCYWRWDEVNSIIRRLKEKIA